jgi:hypothetical protein
MRRSLPAVPASLVFVVTGLLALAACGVKHDPIPYLEAVRQSKAGSVESRPPAGAGAPAPTEEPRP